MNTEELLRRLRECEGRESPYAQEMPPSEYLSEPEPRPSPAPSLRGGGGGNGYFREPAPSLPPRRRLPPVTPEDYIRGYALAPEADTPREVPESNQYFQELAPSPVIPPSGPSRPGRKPRPGDARKGGYELRTMELRDRNRNGIDDRDERDGRHHYRQQKLKQWGHR